MVLCYITEAHAADEWPIGPEISTRVQPTSDAERVEAANELSERCGMPMLVDTIENNFEEAFAAWPFRFWGVENGKLSLVAWPATTEGNPGYSKDDAIKWLSQ